MNQYTREDIARIINKPVRTVKHWSDLGIVHHDGAPTRGRGYVWTCPDQTLVEFLMVDFMGTDLGLPLYAIRGALRVLRGELEAGADHYLDPRLGRQFELFYHYEITNIKGEDLGRWRYFTTFSAKGEIIIKDDEMVLAGEDSILIYPGQNDEARFEKLSDWAKDVAAFAVLKIGYIRNKALEKRQITIEGGKLSGA